MAVKKKQAFNFLKSKIFYKATVYLKNGSVIERTIDEHSFKQFEKFVPLWVPELRERILIPVGKFEREVFK